MIYCQQASIVYTLEVDGMILTGNQPKNITFHVMWLAESERIVTLNKHETYFMNEIDNSVFREGIGWRVPVFQDGDYALTIDSASLSTCQMVVPFGNYHHFKTNFLLLLKGGYARFNVYIFHFKLTDLDLWNAFCEVSPWGSFLFTPQKQKKVCIPGDEAIMKIHKKLFSGIPIKFTFFVISPKLQRIWSWNFGFATRKIWAFIWYQKMYYFRLSPGGWECDRYKVL